MTPYLTIALFPVFFGGLWCLITYGLSFIGWRTLARTYRVAKIPGGESYPGRSGYVNICSYRNCLNVTFGPTGMGLSIMFLFRLGHPPLLLPWETLLKAEEEKFLFLKNMKIKVVASNVTVTVYLPASAREDIIKYRPDLLTGLGL